MIVKTLRNIFEKKILNTETRRKILKWIDRITKLNVQGLKITFVQKIILCLIN